MSQWLAHADDLLYDGEHVETEVDVGDGGVVVTSHRVLAFTPDAAGSNYEYVDRPNVGGVERTTRGSSSFLAHAVKALVVGGVLVAAGQVVSLDETVGTIELGTTGGMGLGGFLGVMQSLLTVLTMLDEIMTTAGALALLAGAVLLGAYAWTRQDLLVVEVAGGDDVELPAPETDEDVADQLDRAVRPDVPSTEPNREAGRDPLG